MRQTPIITASACRHALLYPMDQCLPTSLTELLEILTVKLDERPLPTPMRFMADVTCNIIVHIPSSSELLFVFKVDGDKWEIRECDVDEHVDVLHFDE